MCGLGGEFRLDGGRPDAEAVARMSPCLERRGPDSKGTWSHGPVAFLHHRLRIIDLSPAGSQPMVDEELRLALVFNGCIYNHHELRRELEGHGYRFRSTSDTEVVLKAYHRWGTACVERFLGMFAFVVHELDSGRLVMARDRLGIKPLYLSETPQRIRFASSLPALTAAGDVDTSIDRVALHHYLSWHSVVPAPRTVLNGVRKLPPATVRVIEPDGSGTETVYWNPPATRSSVIRPEEWRERTLAALDLAVQRRMVADVPVGVLLSGGLDSSLVVALLARAGQSGLATFSIGFDAVGGESGDEFEYSDLVAKEFDTDHHKIPIPPERLASGVDGAIAAMSEPMVSHDCVAFYLLSEEVSKKITVVQSGQGADEVFAGYDWYPPLRDVPREDAVAAYSKVFFDRPDATVAQLLNPDWYVPGDPSTAFVREHFAAPGAQTTLDAALRIDSRVMLVDDPVKRVDNMTMAWGLEARVPFLDHELVELAAQCPPELKLAHGGKGVLKEAARGVVPDAVIDRTKGYFPVPGVRHLEGSILDRVRDALTSSAARDRGLFRDDVVTTLLADPNTARTTIGANVLWQIGLLELWLQRTGL
ncbi:N-acetylglutaminylglutamine amidotransferase [Kineosporia rhizophila]|uniref:N-acetylglutaminylglutamine amidotransferase n=1 Tax=Kineosporia TaxID=49184 RepID=UPI001E4A4E77|nr:MULTISPECIES: N-acetylglutaminylglutamine amidotransferase [Kineosporia]MCE0534220.1 N-acetylglutaminylglutamine amidotransferase [Kineosporia rhizophila]GLY13768.1 asparagine synthetase B [Kineosporia sp. NBRC 101677]